MKRVKNLLSELLKVNIDGAICRVSSQCFRGEFDIERIGLQDNGEFLNEELKIVTNAGSFIVSLDSFIEKLDVPYKWGYKIVGADMDRNPIKGSFIELGEQYNNDELFEIEEKEYIKQELARILSEDE